MASWKERIHTEEAGANALRQEGQKETGRNEKSSVEMMGGEVGEGTWVRPGRAFQAEVILAVAGGGLQHFKQRIALISFSKAPSGGIC